MSGINSVQQQASLNAASAIISLAVVAWLASPPFADAKSMNFPVTCNVSGTVKAARADQLCTEMIALLSQTHPDITFRHEKFGGPPSLNIIIHTATNTAAAVQLAWTTASGRTITGERMSVSAMDTTLTPSKRTSLYRRALAATPMPTE